ncbi:hypothetical protein [Priestia aryabhattai]|uniref:hypothetical protein n=1 Tax=Priestia aryabhattai TaxID=412384 RepID=UPI0015F6A626|nr:hypothetical protein [Priestia aryabhattai]
MLNKEAMNQVVEAMDIEELIAQVTEIKVPNANIEELQEILSIMKRKDQTKQLIIK